MMTVNHDWAKGARTLLKAELKHKEDGYKELASRLTEDSMPEAETSVTNKIPRGTFSAAFIMQCLKVIGCHTIRLDS